MRLRTYVTLVLTAVLSAFLSAQLPGPPVGVPQTQQSASHGYNFAYSFTPTGADGSAVDFATTLRTTTITGATQDAVRVNPTFILPNSNAAATTFAGLRVLTPTLTLNSGAATNLANVKVEAAGSGATNNYSLWVVGQARFDSTVGTLVTVVGSLPSCAAGIKGYHAFVTDANAATFHTTAAGGGTNNVAVVCDGTNWYID